MPHFIQSATSKAWALSSKIVAQREWISAYYEPREATDSGCKNGIDIVMSVAVLTFITGIETL